MKRFNYLKGLRVLLAILFFVPILLYFVDFAGLVPDSVSKLLHLQLIPAILGGMVLIVVIQLLLTLVFGRIYCSVICPAGVLQDVINRLFCIGKKKKNGPHRFKYHKPMNIFRYVLLGGTFVLAIFGLTGLVLFLDPYSNFGRIAANLFRPVVIWGNNILADVLARFDNYTLYHLSINTVASGALIAGSIALLVFVILVIFRGRLFCNTLCPLGALLSIVSRYSFFRVSIDKKTCISCGLCEKTCKAEAIDTETFSVDASRCVDCFNCVSSCKKDSIQYRFKPFFRKKTEKNIETENKTTSNTRRSFLATGVVVAASLPTVSAIAQRRRDRNDYKYPVTPPGSVSLARFSDMCTGCHICVVKCPSQILKPAGMQFGFDYLLKPYMSYDNSYCNYKCTVCSDICPVHALKPLSVEEKVTTQVGIAKFYINRCIVKTDKTDCGACSEHCPTQAVHMVPNEGTLTIPQVEPDLCIGCGGCESICPVRPDRAIIIKANQIHQKVDKPEEEEIKEIEVDDFGF